MRRICAIASLERKFDVVVITQNVDNLHERAGSKHVLHVHGELCFARGSGRSRKRYRIDGAPIELGQKCEEGTQLRPDIVWFGEETQHMEEAGEHVAAADKVLVVGTSLSVYPAASLVEYARQDAEKILNSLEMESVPPGFEYVPGRATVDRAAGYRPLVRARRATSQTRRHMVEHASQPTRCVPSECASSWSSSTSRKAQ